MLTIMPVILASDGGALQVDPKDATDWMVIEEGNGRPFRRKLAARQDMAVEVARGIARKNGYSCAVLSTKTLGSSVIAMDESCGASEYYVVPMVENRTTGEFTVCADKDATTWGVTKKQSCFDTDHDPIDSTLAQFNTRYGADRLLSKILDYRDPPVYVENNEDFTD